MSRQLRGDEIRKLIEEEKLFIRPLLQDSQIGMLSVDFRLGTEFMVSFQGRQPYINVSYTDRDKGKPTSFFQETRRRLGDRFLLHPNQIVLASSLEYIKMPKNLVAMLSMRSTYSRLGLVMSSYVHPGYSGCISIELTNTGNNAVNLTVGARLFQASFSEIDEELNYFDHARKYICQVRPIVSDLSGEEDLENLHQIWSKRQSLDCLKD